MTLKEVLAELKSLGNPSTFKVHKKAGADDNMYGVKMGDIRKIAAKIKSDDALALELWSTGNLDARLLAVLLFKPKNISRQQLDRMVREASFPWLADWLFSNIIRNHADNEALRQEWMHDADPWAARAGWSLTSSRINKGEEGVSGKGSVGAEGKGSAKVDVKALLERIELEMAQAHPATQWTMNNVLAGIGIHFPEYRKRALAIGERLGVYRDYPVSKGCTSPFAPIWINEMVKRQV